MNCIESLRVQTLSHIHNKNFRLENCSGYILGLNSYRHLTTYIMSRKHVSLLRTQAIFQGLESRVVEFPLTFTSMCSQCAGLSLKLIYKGSK